MNAGGLHARGPLALHERPDLLDPPTLLPPGESLPILSSDQVLLPGIPGSGQEHAVRRLVTRWTLQRDGAPVHAAPEMTVELAADGAPRLVPHFQPHAPFLASGGLLLALAGLVALASRRAGALASRGGFALALLALALAAAGAGFLRAGAEGRFTTLDGDEVVYARWAAQLAQGAPLQPDGFGIGWPLLLAPAWRALGIGPDAASASLALGPVTGSVLGPLTVVVTALLAAGLWGSRGRGMLAGALVLGWMTFAQHPHVGWPPGDHAGRTTFGARLADSPWDLDLYYWSLRSGWSLLSDAPAALLLAGALLSMTAAMARLREGRGARLALALSGALLGLACAVRTAAIPMTLGLLAAVALGEIATARSGERAVAAGRLARSAPWLAAFGALFYLPQALVTWRWVGTPLATTFALNGYDRVHAVRPLFSLARAVTAGLPFYGAYHATLALAAAAALIAAARSGGAAERRAVIVLSVATLGVVLPMAAYAYGSNQPERLVLAAIPLLCVALAGCPGPPVALALWLLAIAFVPGWPLPEALPLPWPREIAAWVLAALALGCVVATVRRLITLRAAAGTGLVLAAIAASGLSAWPAWLALAAAPLVAMMAPARQEPG